MVILGLVFFRRYPTSIETSTDKDDPKSLPHQGAKIGGMVTATMKPANFLQIWPLFMNIDTIKENFHIIKHVDISVLSETRPTSCKTEIYTAR